MANINLSLIRERRSFEAGYRPGMGGSRPLLEGEPFVNFPDKVRCIGTGDGGFVESALDGASAFLGGLLINGSATPKANGGIAFDDTDASPADRYGVAPPSGFVPGDHLRSGAVAIFETRRDNTCQEIGLLVELHNKTGAGGTDPGSINDGKTCLSYAAAGYPAAAGKAGGGNMWGVAGTVTLKTGYAGKFVAGVEFDLNNNSYNSGLGYSGGNVCGIFQNGISEFMSLAAHWIIGTKGNSAPAFYDIGTFYQEGATRLIRSATILDSTSSDVVLKAGAGKSHAEGTIVDQSNGLVAMDVAGNKSNSFIWTRGQAPIGLKLQGTVSSYGIEQNDGSPTAYRIWGAHTVAAIDTRDATTPYALLAAAGQKITQGGFSWYSRDGKLVLRNDTTSVDIMSVDGNGNVKALGTITQGTP